VSGREGEDLANIIPKKEGGGTPARKGEKKGERKRDAIFTAERQTSKKRRWEGKRSGRKETSAQTSRKIKDSLRYIKESKLGGKKEEKKASHNPAREGNK